MSKQENTRKEPAKAEMKKDSEIVKTDTWMNKTQRKVGFIIRFKEDFKEGDIVIGSIANLQAFINDEQTGVRLSKLVPLEE